MHYLTLVFFLAVTTINLSAQDYKFFNSTSRKLFITYPTESLTYSIAFDSAVSSGSDTSYFNYFAVSDSLVTSSCPWWGDNQCYPQNVPSWLGSQVTFDNNGTYRFFNNSGDTIGIDINMQINDTSIIFEDSIQRFLLSYENNDTLTVLQQQDSVKYFRIIHTDLNGNIIQSALHNQYIITAKSIGLVRFFQVDSFPAILRPLQLLASDPNLGMMYITNEMIYDYSVGDEFQFNNYHFKFTQFPGNYNYYEKFSILNKTVTPDSIIYQAARYKFDHDSLSSISDTVFLKYFRFDTIAVVPYESFVNIKSEFFSNSYCGINLWTYHTYGSIGLSYCATEKCWGPMDTNGPTPQRYTTYIAGIGEINYSFQWNITFTQTEIISKTLVYFKKDGIACGSPIYAGIPEIGSKRHLNIYPNPAADYIHIESAHPVNQFQIFNYDGQLIESEDAMTQGHIIRLEGLEPGVYFIRAEMSSGLFVQEKFIIIR